MILIVTNPREDGHVRPVTDELTRRGLDYKVFDPATYPESSTITVERIPAGVRAVLATRAYELDIGDVRSVWYRRPGDFVLSDQLAPEEADWLKTETGILFPQMADTDGLTYDAETTAWLKSLDALIKARHIGLTIFHYSMWTDNRAGRTIFLDWFGGLWIPYASHNPVDTWAVRPLPVMREGVSAPAGKPAR